MLIAIGLAAGGAAFAQQGRGPLPVFGTGIELVQVDVSVLDRNRRPVRGLEATDFTLFEDGKPRPIAAFAEVSLPPRAGTRGAAWTREVPFDNVTNDVPDEGRLIVILMDRTIPFGLPAQVARRVARAAVDQLVPGDLASVVYSGSRVAQNFTSDRARLIAALGFNASAGPSREAAARWEVQRDRLETDLWESIPASSRVDPTVLPRADPGIPGSPRVLPTDESGECHCGVCVLDTITSIADGIRDVRGRQKLLLFIGADITIDKTGEFCEGRVVAAREAMFRSIELANLTVHSFDANGLESNAVGASSQVGPVDVTSPRPGAQTVGMAMSRELLRRQGNLKVLPDRTGGRTILNTNDPAGRVPEILRESETYYLLGFEPSVGDGRQHSIRVEVNRPRVTVRSRRAYLSPARRIAAAAPPLLAPAHEAITGIIAKRSGLTLTANALPVAMPTTRAPALIVALHAQHTAGDEPPAGGPAGAERVEVLTEVLTTDGRSVGTFHHAATVTPHAGTSGSGSTYDLLHRIGAAPGRYELRIGVSNTTRGQSGSVYLSVDVPPFGDAPLTWSGIGLAAGTTPAGTGSFAGVLPALPIARREFDRHESVSAFMSASHTRGSLPTRIEVVAQITDEQNRRRLERGATLASEDFSGTNAAGFRLDLPLASLQPGAYLLTMDARAAGARTRHSLRFTVR